MRKVILKDYRKLSSKIYDFYNKNRKMPSFEELKDIFDVKSKDTVSRLINDLVNLEYVARDVNGKILPKDNYFKKIRNELSQMTNPLEFKMLGTVEAGFPTHVEVQDLESVKFEEWLIGDTFATFMLKVSGNSMLDAGICAGDFVIVERAKEPRINDIVLAEVDGAWTLKYYKKDKIGIYLEPANKNFKIIRPKNELNIAAVVVALVRKYAK